MTSVVVNVCTTFCALSIRTLEYGRECPNRFRMSPDQIRRVMNCLFESTNTPFKYCLNEFPSAVRCLLWFDHLLLTVYCGLHFFVFVLNGSSRVQ